MSTDGRTDNDPAGGIRFLLFVCHAWATSVEVFLHHAPGTRYLGLQAAFVLVLVPFNVLFWERHDIRGLLYFIPAYIAMCLIARLGMLRRWKRGENCHSYYSGAPRFMGPKAKCSELTFKRVVEPVFVAGIGASFCILGQQPLGVYLMWAAACLFISVNASALYHDLQAVEMRDSILYQEQIAERFRNLRGDQ